MAQIFSLFLVILKSLALFLLHFARAWWWVFLPFLLAKLFQHFWLWWRIDDFISKCRWELLEVKVPQDIDNPFRRMEAVLAGMWQVRIGKNKREKWLEGKTQLGVSLEVASFEGKVHFYVRSEVDDLELLKTSIYAQFPSAEITQTEDYSKQVPADIPNKEWTLWSSVYRMKKDDVYPIRTYTTFFEEQPTTFEEEAIRVDPMGQLLEGMSKLGPGEQMWIQIMISPILLPETGHIAKGKKIVDKIVRRPEKGGPATTQGDIKKVLAHLATGSLVEEKTAKEEVIPPEMRITPGERAIIEAIDEKLSKVAFATEIRSLYLAKRDVYSGEAKATPMSYFNQFSTEHLNGIVVDSDTWTKVRTIFTWFFDKRRLYLRQRKHFRHYRWRYGQYWPRNITFTPFFLNIEEIATIFHFPGKLTAPSAALPRVEAKKGEAPGTLPVA